MESSLRGHVCALNSSSNLGFEVDFKISTWATMLLDGALTLTSWLVYHKLLVIFDKF